MRYAYLILLAIFVSCANLHKSIEKKEVRADYTYSSGKFQSAIKKYKKLFTEYEQIQGTEEQAMEAQKSATRVGYKIARAYHKTGDVVNAEEWYLKAEERGYQKTKPKLYYYLGELSKQKGDSEKALEYFNKYEELDPKGSKIAAIGRASVEKIAQWSDPNVNARFEAFKMDALSSPDYSDYAPQIASNEADTLFFTSNREGAQGTRENEVMGAFYTDIFFSVKDENDEWTAPQPLENKSINTVYSDGVVSFSQDFKTMLYTYCEEVSKENNSCVIKMSKFNSETQRWSAPVTLKMPDLKGATIGHPALSPDKNRLYFSSDFQDSTQGLGGKDIWYADIVTDSITGANKLDTPVNIGAPVNTPGDELFPYVREDGRFYFASNGHIGLGGLDVYEVVQKKSGKDTVRNLKAPINSVFDDFGITYAAVTEAKSQGFFSTNRNDKGVDNIWSFTEYPEKKIFKLAIVDAKTKKAIPNAKAEFGEETLYTEQEKPLEIPVQMVESLDLKLSKQAYLPSELNVQLADIDEDAVTTIFLQPLNRKEAFTSISKDEEEVLDSLAKVLKKHPKVKLSLEAHEDYKGTNLSNLKKTKARADELVDKMMAKGIESDRLLGLGFGEEVPLKITKKLRKEHKFFPKSDLNARLDSVVIVKYTKPNQVYSNMLNKRLNYTLLDETKFAKKQATQQKLGDKIALLEEEVKQAKLAEERALAAKKEKEALEAKMRAEADSLERAALLAKQAEELAKEQAFAANLEAENKRKDSIQQAKLLAKQQADLAKQQALATQQTKAAETPQPTQLAKQQATASTAGSQNWQTPQNQGATQTDADYRPDYSNMSEEEIAYQKELAKLKTKYKNQEVQPSNWWDDDAKTAQKTNKSQANRFSFEKFKDVIVGLTERKQYAESSGDILVQVGSFRNFRKSAKLRDRIKRTGMITSQEKIEVLGKTWYRVYIIHKTGAKNIQATYKKLLEIGVTETPIVRLINW